MDVCTITSSIYIALIAITSFQPLSKNLQNTTIILMYSHGNTWSYEIMYGQKVCGGTREDSCYCRAGNSRGRKLSRIGKKYDFRGENFRGLLPFAVPWMHCPQILRRKLFTNSHKTKSHKTAKFTKVFSLESFPLYSNISLLLT